MTETLPWDNEKPLSVSQLLKQSMRSVDTIATNTSLLDKMSTHLNGLLRGQAPQVDKAVQLLDNMFLNASKAMETENDKQVLSVLQRQVSSFIGVTLGVKPFLEHQEQQQKERAVASDSDSDSDTEDNKLSWSSAQEKEISRKDRWLAKLLGRKEKDADIYAPDRAEHERLRKQLDEESDSDGEVGSDKEDSDDDNSSESEYEEVIERIPIKTREIGGAGGGFQVVRRKQKKKKTTIATNFTYSSTTTTYDNNQAPSYNNNNNYRKQPRHRVRICEFRPKMLERLSCEQIYCMPIFFPSEDSYLVFHSALATAKKTLYVCVFSFTDNDTADVLIDAQNRGVDVKIVTDNDQMDTRKGADVLRLSDQFGIPYKMDNSDQFMHNKFAVIDNRIVITGSFNWSAGARFKNRENVVVTNIPSVVRAYAQEFDHLWRIF
ncbi:hypothetical protein BDF21DRAFT_454116 [Thamnidium elegans]|uniref:Mitochondrial cardiolipin hydrolase n=1 Tax=Thamnidium elegans TaxID=101142 RepID=A0A8H7T0C3_9FUNG|nr:hypothetical protein INT48_005558 [Thamnidium elegans]KAI8071993.1 hypothetical protein BDF21DRAFT_454116 [Thamnidium elegans]